MNDTIKRSCASEPASGLSKAEEDLKERLAYASRILSLEGHDDFNQGQVSARIPRRDQFFIKKAVVGFNEAVPSDMVLACHDHTRPSSMLSPPELPLHQAIYAARPDVNAIIHSHAPYSLVFGATDLELLPVSHDGACFQGRIARFTQTSQTILSIETGQAVAHALGSGMGLFLRNHGLLAAGKSLRDATVMALLLERACRLQLLAVSSGQPFHVSDASDVKGKQEYIYDDTAIKTYWDYKVRQIRQLKRDEWKTENISDKILISTETT